MAERESQEKSRFLTTLSHELRTPLHGVLGYADQLSREGGLSPDQSRQLGEIIRAGKHMRDVVNVVLDYARIEALGPALHMKHVDVRASGRGMPGRRRARRQGARSGDTEHGSPGRSGAIRHR